MASPSDFIVQPVNVLGAYMGGQQMRQQQDEGIARNALLKTQQQNALNQEQRAQAGEKRDATKAGQDEQRQLIEDLAKVAPWYAQAQTPEDQAQRREAVLKNYESIFGAEKVAPFRDPARFESALAWAQSQKSQLLNVAPGGALIDPNNPTKPVYQAPFKPEEAKTGKPEALYDLNGKQLGTGEYRNGKWFVGDKAYEPSQVTTTAPQKQGAAGLPPAVRSNAISKIQAVRQVREQLAKVQESFNSIKGSFSAGFGGQGMMPSKAGQDFDRSVALLGPLLRQLTRVPGEGAMSDYESRMVQATLPDRGTYEGTTQQQIQQLSELADTIERGYAGLLEGEPPATAGATQPAAPGQPAANPQREVVVDF